MRHIERHQFSVPLRWYCWCETTLKGKHGFWKLSANVQAILKIFHTQDIEYSEILFPVCICCGPWLQRAPLCTQCDFFNYFLKLLLLTECKEALWVSSFLARQITSQGQNRSTIPAVLRFSEMTPGKDFFSSQHREQQVFLRVITLDGDVSSTRVLTGQSKWQDRQKWKSGVSSQSKFKVCCAPAL